MTKKESNAKKIETLKAAAKLLDSQFTVPFTSYKIGLDAIIGMVPVAGDTVTSLISLLIMYQSFRFKTSTFTKFRMLNNIAFDWAIGLIPFVGDIFDIGYRSNVKNINLLCEMLEKEEKNRVKQETNHSTKHHANPMIEVNTRPFNDIRNIKQESS